MNERTLSHLEYQQVLSIFEGLARTPGGKRAFNSLTPSLSRQEVEKVYEQCDSLREIVSFAGPCPLGGIPELQNILERLRVSGVILLEQELLDIALFIGKLQEIRNYFQKAEEGCHRCYAPVVDAWEGIPFLKSLKDKIETAIDPKGYIQDKASPRLRELRKKAEQEKSHIQKSLERLIRSRRLADRLADRYYTIRNGRYVLPLKAGSRHLLQGIIHDQSQSRLTVFVEPLECVSLNNNLAMVLQEIEREKEAIRRYLTQKVVEGLDLLWKGWRVVTRLDEIHARVVFMDRYRATTVSLRDEPGFNLIGARHPLLLVQQEENVVPIDLKMPKGKQILILSGANAGGKTVALKTLGVSVLMAKSGLPLPVRPGSELFLFEQTFTEMGDEQSISDALSTFTAHIQHLKEIVRESTPDSLILIDEIGAGTGMSEGAALALGVLDVLQKRGATIMVTTHFELLKGYGAKNEKAINVSVSFDTSEQVPLFTLCYGLPGNSNAFETARRQGLDREVLEAAERYRDHQDRLLTELMAKVERIRQDMEAEKEAVAAVRREIENLKDQFYVIVEEIKGKKREILKNMQLKWERQIKRQKEEFRVLMEKAKGTDRSDRSFHASYSELKGRFNRLVREAVVGIGEEESSVEVNPGYQAAVGDEVFVTTVGKPGKVTAVHSHQGTADVVVKGMRLQVPLKRLSPWKRSDGKETGRDLSYVGLDVATAASTELNVVGYRVQDALPEVDKFIDTALVHRLKEVTIIHGVGSGRLRQAIREFLKRHEGIESFSDGDLRRGGHGVTVVRLH